MHASVQRKWRVFYTRARAEKKCEQRLVQRRRHDVCFADEVLSTWRETRGETARVVKAAS